MLSLLNEPTVLPEVGVHDVRHVWHADRGVEVGLADEELGARHEVAQLEARDLAAEGVLQLLAEALDHREAAVRAPQQHLQQTRNGGAALNRRILKTSAFCHLS